MKRSTKKKMLKSSRYNRLNHNKINIQSQLFNYGYDLWTIYDERAIWDICVSGKKCVTTTREKITDSPNEYDAKKKIAALQMSIVAAASYDFHHHCAPFSDYVNVIDTSDFVEC